MVLCPSDQPTDAPTELPTEAPTDGPTDTPTEVTTESQTGEPTEGPTEGTTEAPGGGCLGTLNNYNAWGAGSTGQFEIIVPEDIETWEMTVTFDQPIDSFEAYEGSEEKCEDMTCTFTNENWNGNKKDGEMLFLNFQSDGDNPSIISFAFNGALCDEPPTTTAAPTEETTDGTTEVPTEVPTDTPTEGPTDVPTDEPTDAPTDVPSEGPPSETTEAQPDG